MQKIIHLSDLHFGRENQMVLETLYKEINVQQPSLVVISGDLTQRARTRQFIQAREFINSLNYPILVVPGNHDISLFNVLRRLVFPMRRYKKYISQEEFPMYVNGEIAVIGINTARPYLWKEGVVSHKQVKFIQKKFCNQNTNQIKILVTHHPVFPSYDHRGCVIHSDELIKTLLDCKIDLLLAGHLHRSRSEIYEGDQIQTEFKGAFILAQASTSISNRLREKFNSYNLILINENTIKINVRKYENLSFIDFTSFDYEKISNRWRLIKKDSQL